MYIANVPANRLQFARSELMVVDLWIAHPDLFDEDSKEWAADFMNAYKPGTTFEVFDLATSVSREPSGCHMLIRRDELPAWEAAASQHGVRLVPTRAPLRHNQWDGGASMFPCPPDTVILELPV